VDGLVALHCYVVKNFTCVLCVVLVNGAEGPLVMDIANHVRYWILHQDLPLQSLAVKTIYNLSLIKSERTAIAQAGILDSITRKYCLFLVLVTNPAVCCPNSNIDASAYYFW